MVAIVLICVMFDRPTLTLRTLTVAALAVLLLAPEAIVHPSFQMSFAATLAIVAGYQGGFAVMRANPIRRWARGLRSSACARSWAWC
jgi:predicted membrane metal-binding protein